MSFALKGKKAAIYGWCCLQTFNGEYVEPFSALTKLRVVSNLLLHLFAYNYVLKTVTMSAMSMAFLLSLLMHRQAFAAHIKLLCVVEHNNDVFCCVAEYNTDNHILSCLKY